MSIKNIKEKVIEKLEKKISEEFTSYMNYEDELKVLERLVAIEQVEASIRSVEIHADLNAKKLWEEA